VFYAIAVLAAGCLIKGIHYERPLDLFIAALLLGILNAVLRPILVVLAMPLLIVTFGLFFFVINALVLYFVGFVLRPHFYVGGFWDAFWGALIISFVSTVLHAAAGTGRAQFRVKHHHRDEPGDGGGPIIDV
jgi:putative membrane protein